MDAYQMAMDSLRGPQVRERLAALYSDPAASRERYERLVLRHQQVFGDAGGLHLLSAPGRSELIGNHTDHNRGLVLAAAVNLDTVAAASRRDDQSMNLYSEGYGLISLTLEDLRPLPSERGTSAALLRGIAAGMRDMGLTVRGFDAVVASDVITGSGLSSSAAFEVLACAILDALYNGFSMDAAVRARIGQYAENEYFMKPSGLMDQMASSCGGIVAMDFQEDDPKVDRLHFSFSHAGYALMIINTGGSHHDLTDAYAGIPADMKAAARILGGRSLREFTFGQLLDALPEIRCQAGDVAALRAMHYYQENVRVAQAVGALKQGDLESFFREVNASGISSWTLLQNIAATRQEQPLALALALAQAILKGRGACRVHGGGFAGTTLNFVPMDLIGTFTGAMEAMFARGCCHLLDVRRQGPAVLLGA